VRIRISAGLLAFFGGAALVAAVAGIFLLLSGGGGDGTDGGGGPSPTSGPYPILADGQYIDSLADVKTIPSDFSAVPMTYLASKVGAIAVVEITGIVSSGVPSPGPGTRTPSIRRFQPLPWTTYTARVEQWIKGGNGQTEITISELGGIDYDGPRLFTGTFLAQTGRKYLVAMDERSPDAPGTGDYAGALSGWANFEVGDGTIHVLNENNSRRLMGAYNLTPLDEFIAMIREWIVARPGVTPTPPPSQSASP